MDYEVNILVHILHRFNLGLIVTHMVEEEPNGSCMDTWLDSPYIYDIYDTNDGDSMTVMTQVRYQGWNMKYLTYQVEIEHPIELLCDLEKPNGFLLNLGEDERWRERPHDIAWAATPIRLGFCLWMYLKVDETIIFYKIHG